MGGFSVSIDWASPQAPHITERMTAIVPHRATGGTSYKHLEKAHLAEFHTGDPEARREITTVGPLSLVGNLRLWARDSLIARAGGTAVARRMDDRRLLLAAYARTGIGFLDDVDGDFAFIIWDAEEGSVLAVRDRCAVKPLYYEETRTGIRFASEVKQLLAVSDTPPTPCDTTVAEYLTDQVRSTALTYFSGIRRVEPAQYLLGDASRLRTGRYWEPTFDPIPGIRREEVPHLFRECLADSVERRIAASDGIVMHVTGGLDSSSISAAAADLQALSPEPIGVTTASAVFSDPSLDESEWIDQIVAAQPFEHVDFTPHTETPDDFASAAWQVDGPTFNRIRGMWQGTATVANTVAADIIAMGSGGDEILDQEFILPDLVGSGWLSQWWDGVQAEASVLGTMLFPIERSIRYTLPSAIKRPLRRLLNQPRRAAPGIVRPEIESLIPEPDLQSGVKAPSRTQEDIITSTWAPRRVILNEAQEAEYAHFGVDVSYPYLDRDLIEFMASLRPQDRPLDGFTKSLVRLGFADALPRSVLERTTKTIADRYLSEIFDRVSTSYRAQYAVPPRRADKYIATDVYRKLLDRLDSGWTDETERRTLWNMWVFFSWLDGFDRYCPSKPSR